MTSLVAMLLKTRRWIAASLQLSDGKHISESPTLVADSWTAGATILWPRSHRQLATHNLPAGTTPQILCSAPSDLPQPCHTPVHSPLRTLLSHPFLCHLFPSLKLTEPLGF